MAITAPDLDAILDQAITRRAGISWTEAKDLLGDLIDDRQVEGDAVVVVRGDEVWLPPSAWIRAVHTARERAARR